MRQETKYIEDLIKTNIEIWHKDTLVRSKADIPRSKKGDLYLQARVFNAQRGDLKDRIDDMFGDVSFSKKVNYYRGEESC